jgi:methionyl-tRNA formyltransferase
MMKIVFFGTPPFAAQVLQDLFKAGVDVVAVVSKPDRPQGRSLTPVATPVKVAAQTHKPSLLVHQPDVVSDPGFSHVLEAYHADLFVVVAYGEIIKQHLLDMPRLGCINLHASLLPKYRGAAPIQRCIINGEKESGITIMHMVKKMDAGDIISVVTVPIGAEMTYGELEKALCLVGSDALIKAIHDLEKGVAARIPQDHTQVTFAPKIELEDCEIRWSQPAQTIHNLVRGVSPHPGAWCYVYVRGAKKRLKIKRTRLITDRKGNPGEVLAFNLERAVQDDKVKQDFELESLLMEGDHSQKVKAPSVRSDYESKDYVNLSSSTAVSRFNKEGFIVACQEGAVQILELQLEGKKAMAVDDFIRGLPNEKLDFCTSVFS